MGTPTVRVDPELARISVGLQLASQFRLWVIGRHLTRNTNGSSQVSKQALKAAVRRYHITYTRQYLNVLLARGEALFWNTNRDNVYLRSGSFVARQLTQRALDQTPDLLLNKAGVTDVWLSPAGSLEQWHATIYAGWLAYRENPTISRNTLQRLFNRSADTLRRWESDRLAHTVTPRANYAQCALVETWDKVRPEPTSTYIASTREGHQVRFLWQVSNTYLVKGIKAHRHRGQSQKVRKAVNQQLQQPANIWRGGSLRCKLYFDSPKHLQDYLNDHDGVYYLWRGENRHRHGIFEATETGWSETTANERLSFAQERRLQAAGQVHIRL